MKNRIFAGVAVAAVIGLGAVATPASASGFPGNYTVINTGTIGVASRYAPYLNAIDGYGAPAGGTVTVYCFVFGDPVGPYNNRLWHLVSYLGHNFYAPDRYLSTPTVTTNVPPPDEYGCQ
ncbi:MAG TPA: hypothetical protein VIQ79_13430 [Kribbella sp.]|jgi:hypothetical protein